MRVFLVVILLFTTIVGQEKSDHYVIQEVNEITNFFYENNWDELQFRLIIHETLTNEQFNDFKKQYENMKQVESLNHQYDVVKLDDHRVKVIYDLQAQNWNEDAQNEFNNFIKSDIFRLNFENSRIYPCIQSQINVKISGNFTTNDIVEYFDVNIENRLIENNFEVISGSTHFFEQLIPLNNNEINIQFSVREIDETRKNVTIGTPILVIEY